MISMISINGRNREAKKSRGSINKYSIFGRQFDRCINKISHTSTQQFYFSVSTLGSDLCSIKGSKFKDVFGRTSCKGKKEKNGNNLNAVNKV